MYTSAEKFNGIQVYDINAPEPQVRPMLKGLIPPKTPDLKKWEQFTEVKEGHFWVPHGQLRDLRIHFLLNGQCPRTTLSGLTCISKLVVRADGEDGKRTKECHIRQLPGYHDVHVD